MLALQPADGGRPQQHLHGSHFEPPKREPDLAMQVLMEPSLLMEDGHSVAAAAAAGFPPTASPPVTTRTAAIAMRIFNNASAIQVLAYCRHVPCIVLACMHVCTHAHLYRRQRTAGLLICCMCCLNVHACTVHAHQQLAVGHYSVLHCCLYPPCLHRCMRAFIPVDRADDSRRVRCIPCPTLSACMSAAVWTLAHCRLL